jgi:uncharacterized OsmC-like protein
MVRFTAVIQNAENQHSVTLKTGDHKSSIVIPPKASGFGSSMNGGEALALAVATCYCNDIYREAKKLGLSVRQVTVEVDSDYDGEPGHIIENIVYHVTIDADGAAQEIEDLIRRTDTLAEIHNTLRQGTSVQLGRITAVSRG